MENILDKIGKITNIIPEIKEYRKIKFNEVGVLNNEICDIYHYIENNGLNFAKGHKMVSILQKKIKGKKIG
jgi:hypothetical protein